MFHSNAVSVTSAASNAIKAIKANTQVSGGNSAVDAIKQKLEVWRPGHRKAKTADFMEVQNEGTGEDMDPDAASLGSNLNLKDDGSDRLMPDQVISNATVKIISLVIREQNVLMDVFNFSEVDPSLNLKSWQESLGMKREIPKAHAQKRVM